MIPANWNLLYNNIKQKIKIQKDLILLNKFIRLDVSDQIRPVHTLVSGESGKGKTTAVMIVMSQSEAGIFLDPKGQTLKTAKEIGIENEWTFYKIFNSPRTKHFEQFELNVSELTKDIVSVLAWKKSGGVDPSMHQKLFHFFNLSEKHPEKNYAGFEKFCMTGKDRKLRLLFDEISPILSKDDSGITFQQLMEQKSVLDLVGFDPENRALPMLVKQLLAYRQANWHTIRKKFFFGLDEGQDFAGRHTAAGYAIGQIFSQGRSFNVVGVISANIIGELHGNIKNNAFIMLIFGSAYDIDKFWKLYGINLRDSSIEDTLANLKLENEYGNCVYHNKHTGETKAIHLDYFFKEQKDKAKAITAFKVLPNYAAYLKA